MGTVGFVFGVCGMTVAIVSIATVMSVSGKIEELEKRLDQGGIPAVNPDDAR